MDYRPACSSDERWIGDGTRSFCTSCLAVSEELLPKPTGGPDQPRRTCEKLTHGAPKAALA